MIIAVDGPAASGKGTIARALAEHFGLPHLDTGLLYRAVGLSVLRHGGDPEHEIDALRACGFSDAMLHDPDIRCEAASRSASVVSAHPAVRTALLERQLAFAAPPGCAANASCRSSRAVRTAGCADTTEAARDAASQRISGSWSIASLNPQARSASISCSGSPPWRSTDSPTAR